ncbi:MFS transporter [bacterium]|nr:MFS transporter [bacterium]
MNNKSLYFTLYFFEGAPIGLIWWTIPTLLSVNGIGVDVITTILAFATLPWALKFLLGPLADRFLYKNNHHALTIVSLQGLMVLTLSWIALTGVHSKLLSLMVVLLSVCSAAQDVVIDAWAIARVEEEHRGSVNGAMQAGMLSGKWIFGPGLLIALDQVDWRWATGGLILLICGNMSYLLLRYGRDQKVIAPVLETLSYKSLSFITKRKFLILGVIALLSAFSLEAITGITTPLLIKQGFIETKVGWLLSGTLFTMLLGGLLGGKLSDKFSAKTIFFWSGLCLAPIVILVGLFDKTSAPTLLVASLYLSYALVGAFTASSYAYYMEQAKGSMEATKFTFLMAITNLCESSSAYTTGQLAVAPGSYLKAFTVCGIISLVGLTLLKQNKLEAKHD